MHTQRYLSFNVVLTCRGSIKGERLRFKVTMVRGEGSNFKVKKSRVDRTLGESLIFRQLIKSIDITFDKNRCCLKRKHFRTGNRYHIYLGRLLLLQGETKPKEV